MSPDPTKPVKKATKSTKEAGTGAARAAKPSRLVEALPLSFVQKIKLLLARLWAKLKTWRLRRRARTVVHR
jgi:hypothetical protein